MAASPSARACTPPPTLTRTPHAPRLGGWEDDWPSPRKSSRIASRKEPGRSSSPQRKSSTKCDPADADAVSSSPRKRPIAPDRVHRASAASSESKPVGDVAQLTKTSRSQLLAAQTGMLPTPAKTPAQKEDKKSATDIQKVARTLFAPVAEEQLMPSPKKQGKSYSALDSFVEDDDEFPIHVDSNARVPERDQTSDNPFDDAYVREPAKKRRSLRKVAIPGEGSVPVEKAVGRDDGMLMNFRGRTAFHKHAAVPQEREDDTFNPPAKTVARRLFTPAPKVEKKKKTAAEIEEEEAETDVEDDKVGDEDNKVEEVVHAEIKIQVVAEVEVEVEVEKQEVPATPRPQKKKGMPMTPEAPHFGLDTPPDTRRITRSTTKALDKAPSISPSNGGGRLAFADFRVTKTKAKDLVASKPTTRKRPADQLSAPATKRART